MTNPKPKAHELTTEQAVKHLFPKEAREAVVLEAKKARKPAGVVKTSTGKHSS